MELWNITYFQLREKQQILLPDFKAGLKKNYWFDHISRIGNWHNVHLNIPKYMVKTKPIIGRSNFGHPMLSLIEMLKTFKIHQVLTVWNTWHSVGFKSSSRPSCVTHPLASKKTVMLPPSPPQHVRTDLCQIEHGRLSLKHVTWTTLKKTAPKVFEVSEIEHKTWKKKMKSKQMWHGIG